MFRLCTAQLKCTKLLTETSEFMITPLRTSYLTKLLTSLTWACNSSSRLREGPAFEKLVLRKHLDLCKVK